MYHLLLIILVTFSTIYDQTNAYEINADTIEFHKYNQRIVANGNVKTTVNQYQIESDKLIYNLKDKKIELYNNVKIIDISLDSICQSEAVVLDLSDDTVKIQDLYGKFKNATVKAKSIIYNHQLYKGEFITMSICNTCKNGQNIIPFWKIRARKIRVDLTTNNEIKLEDVYFDIFDKQVGYMPFFSLPSLWHKGKTGFLMPNLQNKGLGYQLDIPLYLKASPNLDFTLYPAIGKKTIYGLNMRYRVNNGGYEASIYTGSLPFTNDNNRNIFNEWPANIKINTNLFYPIQELSSTELKQGYEFGIQGEFAFGPKPILLYKYDISNHKMLIGNLYINRIYNNSFASLNMLNLHNLRLNTRTIALPKVNFYNIYNLKLENNVFGRDPLIVTHIASNNISDASFKNKVSNTIGEIKLMIKHYLGANNKITYTTQLTGYQSSEKHLFYQKNKSSINRVLDIHWESKIQYNHKIIEPHLRLHFEPSRESFFSFDKKNHYSIYSTTNNLNPYNIFSSGLYRASNNSIMQKNGNHIDYGFIISSYNYDQLNRNKLFVIIGGRQYLTQPSKFGYINSYNQDLSLAMLQDYLKEKYILQLAAENRSLSIINRTWFTNNLSILNNEFYIDKKFTKLSTKVQYLFLNPKKNFNKKIKQSKFEQFVKLELKYNLSDNWSLGGKNKIKFGQNARDYNITQPAYFKSKIQYANECIKIGFVIKKEFSSRKKFNDNVNSYNFYLKIPSI